MSAVAIDSSAPPIMQQSPWDPPAAGFAPAPSSDDEQGPRVVSWGEASQAAMQLVVMESRLHELLGTQTRREDCAALLPAAERLEEDATLLEERIGANFQGVPAYEETDSIYPFHKATEHEDEKSPLQGFLRWFTRGKDMVCCSPQSSNKTLETVRGCRVRARTLKKKAMMLRKDLQKSSSDVEYRCKKMYGIAAVYNPISGVVEWKEAFRQSVGGAFNEKTGCVEWKTCDAGGVAGVWNPESEEIEWRQVDGASVAGVFHPIQRKVLWQSVHNAGVCGVWDPDASSVVFKSHPSGGIAGWFDTNERCLKWVDQPFGGACVVAKAQPSGYTCSSGLWLPWLPY